MSDGDKISERSDAKRVTGAAIQNSSGEVWSKWGNMLRQRREQVVSVTSLHMERGVQISQACLLLSSPVLPCPVLPCHVLYCLVVCFVVLC